MSTLELKAIIAFANLSRTLDYNLVAEQSKLSVDDLKALINSLEQEIETPLVEQTAAGDIQLTELGQLLLPYAQQILVAQRYLTTQINDFKKKEEERKIHLNVLPAFANYRGSRIVNAVSDHEMILNESDDPYQDLLTGGCDFAFGYYDLGDQIDQLEILPVGGDKLAVYVPARNPISQKESLTLEDLKAEKFLMLNHNQQLYGFLIQLCQAAGFEPYSVFKGERGQTLINMVALGMGITILLEKSVGDHLDPKVVKVPLVPTDTRHLAFARLKHGQQTPEQEDFWQQLRAISRKMKNK